MGGSDGIFCVRYCQINFLVHGLSILEQVEKQFNLTLDHHSVVTPKVKMTQTSPEMKNLFQGSKHHSNPDNHLCNTIGNVDVSKKYSLDRPAPPPSLHRVYGHLGGMGSAVL